jgi:hypothetical protein
MNYYEIYDRYSGELLTRGNAAECRKALGCASLDSFYALANRARRFLNRAPILDSDSNADEHQKKAGR